LALITGTPLGVITQQENLFIEGAPTIFIQNYLQTTLLKNPDSDGFYWGLTGTATYPVIEIACLEGVSLTEDLTINDIRCDTDGVKDTIQQRNFVEFQFAVKSLFPLTTVRDLLKLGAVTTNAGEGTEKAGIGSVNNNNFFHVYAPRVYDEDTGDYFFFHLHKCKFVEAFTLDMRFGDSWIVNGVRLRAFADSTYPVAQKFGAVVRVDPSVI
jgi:hypothetical protein